MNTDFGFWDQTKDERLIDLVRLMPELYDFNSPKYNNQIAQRNAWQTIGAHLMLEPFKCEQRWEYLKAVQRRKPKEVNHGQTGSSSSDWTTKNQKMSCNEFRQTKRKSLAVDPPNTAMQTNDVVNNGEDQTTKTHEVVVKSEQQLLEGTDLRLNNPEDILAPLNVNFQANLQQKINKASNNASTNPNPKRRLGDQGCANLPPHSIDVFFLLMANTVKSFSALDQHSVKFQLFELVHKLEAKYILSQNLVQQNTFTPSLMPPLTPMTQATPNEGVQEEQNPAN